MIKVSIDPFSEEVGSVFFSALEREKKILSESLQHVKQKLTRFEMQYPNRENLDHMLLVEWDGEEETFKRLQERLKLLEEIKIAH